MRAPASYIHAMTHPYTTLDLVGAPDAAALEQLAEAAVAALPAHFRDHLAEVVFRIEDFADAETLASLDITNPWNLSGLYTGRPMSVESVWESGNLPATIHLYRQPILAESLAKDIPLAELVSHVVVHEVAHHFGYSDEEIYALEASVKD